MPTKVPHDQLIQCESCGQDYSVTYRKCPFCGEQNDIQRAFLLSTIEADIREEEEDGYIFDGQDMFNDEWEDDDPVRGGKRLSSGRNSEINWPRLITFLCSLIIIIAALVILFTLIYPRLRSHNDRGNDPNAVQSSLPVTSQPTQSNQPIQQSPNPTDSSDVPTGEVAPSQNVTPSISPTVTGLAGFTLNRTDFTLQYVGETFQMTAAFTPSDWNGAVTWSSSDNRYATVSSTGLVTNVNDSGTLHGVVITATAGGISRQCQVYCRPINRAESSPSPTPPAETTPSSQEVTVGSEGTVVGAGSGLRVRSGPGTSHEVVASLTNGNGIKVLADAGAGWYQISYSGTDGIEVTGYIMGTYISTS